MARLTNRDRILEASLTLFNERGVPVVSTKTIAASLDISPGNLYYHFANKEGIIRELWAQAAGSIAPGIAAPEDGSLLQPEAFAEMLVSILRNMSTSRFIVRDLDELMARDPKLAESLRDAITLGQEQWVAVFDSLISHRVMTATQRRDLERLGISILTLLMNWLRYLVNMGGIPSGSDQELAEGAMHAFVLLEPRLEKDYGKRARQALEHHLQSPEQAASKHHLPAPAALTPLRRRARKISPSSASGQPSGTATRRTADG